MGCAVPSHAMWWEYSDTPQLVRVHYNVITTEGASCSKGCNPGAAPPPPCVSRELPWREGRRFLCEPRNLLIHLLLLALLVLEVGAVLRTRARGWGWLGVSAWRQGMHAGLTPEYHRHLVESVGRRWGASA